jgi:predicted nucleotidyltransferase
MQGGVKIPCTAHRKKAEKTGDLTKWKAVMRSAFGLPGFPQSDIDLIMEIDAADTDMYLLKNSIREFIDSRCNRGVDLSREMYLRPYARDDILKEAIFI